MSLPEREPGSRYSHENDRAGELEEHELDLREPGKTVGHTLELRELMGDLEHELVQRELTIDPGHQLAECELGDDPEHELVEQELENDLEPDLTPEQWQLLEWASALEAPFALNDYNGNMLGGIVYAYQPGSCPILVSCPHAVNHTREDRIKEMDEYTGALGLIVKSKTDCHLMYTTKLYDEDPNYVEGGIYKSELVRLARQHGIRLVIDLHGASTAREFQIDLGTRYGKTLRDSNVELMKEQLALHGLNDVRVNDTFAAMGSGTVTAHVAHHLKIQCVQVEINGKYRSPQTDVESFGNLVEGLTGAIERIKEDMIEHERRKQRIIRSERSASAGNGRRHARIRARR